MVCAERVGRSATGGRKIAALLLALTLTLPCDALSISGNSNRTNASNRVCVLNIACLYAAASACNCSIVPQSTESNRRNPLDQPLEQPCGAHTLSCTDAMHTGVCVVCEKPCTPKYPCIDPPPDPIDSPIVELGQVSVNIPTGPDRRLCILPSTVAAIVALALILRATAHPLVCRCFFASCRSHTKVEAAEQDNSACLQKFHRQPHSNSNVLYSQDELGAPLHGADSAATASATSSPRQSAAIKR